jgi:predicted small lipoprotein YifL
VVLSRCAAALLLLVLAGCGRGGPAAPEDVQVSVGAQQVPVHPTQYCLDGDGKRYGVTPPIIAVSPDSPISLTVPRSVARHGWSVQVFDEKLEEPLGEVDVPKGRAKFDEINTSDVVPVAFYLVVVEKKGGECGEFSGAWPVGFLRAGGDVSGTPSSSAPPAG